MVMEPTARTLAVGAVLLKEFDEWGEGSDIPERVPAHIRFFVEVCVSAFVLAGTCDFTRTHTNQVPGRL